jgi:hypothetical protein
MNENGMSPADFAAMSNNGWGDNSFFWVFALLLLGNGGFGNWGGNNGAVNALNADMQRGFDTQNLQSQTRDILSAVTNGTAQTIAASTANATNAINAIKDGNASLIREFGNVETALTALSGKQQECCCDIKQLIQATAANTDAQIAQNKYEAAMRDAATNANFTAQIQGVKDMIAQDKIESLQAQVSQLQLAQATSGMLRFPNSWSYGAGPFPPMFGCCGNNNI